VSGIYSVIGSSIPFVTTYHQLWDRKLLVGHGLSGIYSVIGSFRGSFIPFVTTSSGIERCPLGHGREWHLQCHRFFHPIYYNLPPALGSKAARGAWAEWHIQCHRFFQRFFHPICYHQTGIERCPLGHGLSGIYSVIGSFRGSSISFVTTSSGIERCPLGHELRGTHCKV
jgi:hypothetical protein